jgi:hypothetical protein
MVRFVRMCPAGHPEDFHDLRHPGNTLAVTAGAARWELMDRRGHDSERAAPVLAITCWVQLRIMAHTIPAHAVSHLPAVFPVIAQLTGWCAVTVAAAACSGPVTPPGTARTG